MTARFWQREVAADPVTFVLPQITSTVHPLFGVANTEAGTGMIPKHETVSLFLCSTS